MGEFLKLKSTREVILDSDNNDVFRITSTCVDSGDVSKGQGLPDTGLFLYRIFDDHDSTTDEFVRIVSIGDIENYLNSRNKAAQMGQEYWRSSVLVKDYTDIEVAEEASRAISDRVNSLVKDYATFFGSFQATDKEDSFPTETQEKIEELQEEYSDAVSAFDDAVEAESQAKTDYEEAQTNLENSKNDLADWLLQQDYICGGDASGVGNIIGLVETYIMFGDLYDGSGSGLYSSSSNSFLNAVRGFKSNFEKITYRRTANLKLTISGASTVTDSTIGKTVTGESSGATAVLLMADNDSGEWWLSQISGSFSIGENVSIDGNISGTISHADTNAKDPWNDLFDTLSNDIDDFSKIVEAAGEHDIKIRADATHNHTKKCSNTQAEVQNKENSVDSYETDLKTKKAAYIEAQATTQAAYDNVYTKYLAVKEILPDWTPDPAMPTRP